MKNIKLLSLIIAILMLAGCSSDDREGTLILFNTTLLEIKVYTMEDTQHSVWHYPATGGNRLKVDLLPGNYIVDTEYNVYGFQIRAEMETWVDLKSGKVTYDD